MTNHLLLVFTSPVPGHEAEYQRWYDDDHLTDILAIEGFVSARRYEYVRQGEPAVEPPTGNLALYEVEGDLQRALDALYAARPTMNVSAALASPAHVWGFSPRGATSPTATDS